MKRPNNNNNLNDSWNNEVEVKIDTNNDKRIKEDDAKKDKKDYKSSSEDRGKSDQPQANNRQNELLRRSSKIHSLKFKTKEGEEPVDEEEPHIKSTGDTEVYSYCRAELHTYVERDRHKTLKMLRGGIKRFPSENYEDLDYFIMRQNFKVYFVVTISKEYPAEIHETLDGIITNIHTLGRKFELTTRDFVVVVVADGLKELHPEYKAILFKNEKITQDPCQRNAVLEANSHYFHLFLTKYRNKIKDIPEEYSCVNVIYLIKEGQHGRKNCLINAYYGIVYEIATKSSRLRDSEINDRVYTLIMNAREVLHKHALYKFLLHFEYYPNIGACHGEKEVDVSEVDCKSMQASQFLENKLDQVFERHWENNFNFIINDTPSLFCYRLKSILAIGVNNHTFFENLIDNFTSTIDTNLYEDAEKAISLDLIGMKYEKGMFTYVPDALCKYQAPKDFPNYLIEKKKHYAATFCAYFYYLFPKELLRSEKSTKEIGLYISFTIYWSLFFILKLFSLGISYNFAYVMMSFCFVNLVKVEGWLMGYYGIILFIMVLLALSRNGPQTLGVPYHILLFLLVPFTCLCLGTFVVSIIYMFAWTDGKINLVSALLIPPALIYSYLLPGILNLQRICKPVAFGVWAYSIYNTATLNLIPIYCYSNIDDFDTAYGAPSDEIRIERRNNFSFNKLKAILFYFFINGIMIFVFLQQQLGTDTWKLQYVEYITYCLAIFLSIKATGAAIDFWNFQCRIKHIRKKFKPSLVKIFSEIYEDHCKDIKDLDLNYIFRFRSFNPDGFDEETEKVNLFANPNVSNNIDFIMRSNLGLGISDDSNIGLTPIRSSIFNRQSKISINNAPNSKPKTSLVVNNPVLNANENREAIFEQDDEFNSEGFKNKEISVEGEDINNKDARGHSGGYYSISINNKNKLSNALGLNYITNSLNYNSEKVENNKVDFEFELK